MTRSAFACARCAAVLATIDHVLVLRVAPGVVHYYNRQRQNVRFRCPCGHRQTHDVPRRVETITNEWLGEDVAA